MAISGNLLEVATICKVYVRGMEGDIPPKYGLKDGTVSPFLDPGIPIDLAGHGTSPVQIHNSHQQFMVDVHD